MDKRWVPKSKRIDKVAAAANECNAAAFAVLYDHADAADDLLLRCLAMLQIQCWYLPFNAERGKLADLLRDLKAALGEENQKGEIDEIR